MDITISLDGILREEQRRDIDQQLAGLAPDPLAGFCRAAIAESADAILSRRPEPALNSQYRLYRLVKHAFDGTIPSEVVVSRLFGITERRAISMISTVAKRYRPDFEKGWIAAVQTAFAAKEAAKADEGGVFRFSAPQSVIDYLREVIAGLSDGRLAPVQKVKGTAERYEIRKDTYNAVCDKLGIGPKKRIR